MEEDAEDKDPWTEGRLDAESESLRRRLTKETEAASAANAKVAALEASLAETKRAHDACAVEQQKLARRVDESDTHASKLVAHAESLMNDLAAVKVRERGDTNPSTCT